MMMTEDYKRFVYPLTGLSFQAGELYRLSGIPMIAGKYDDGPDYSGQEYYYLGDPSPSEVYLSWSSGNQWVTLANATVFVSDDDYMMYGAPTGPGMDSYLWDEYTHTLGFAIFDNESDAIDAGNAWINYNPSGYCDDTNDFYIEPHGGGDTLTFGGVSGDYEGEATYYVLVYTDGIGGSPWSQSLPYVYNPYVIITVYVKNENI